MGYDWCSPRYDGSIPYRWIPLLYETVARLAGIKLDQMEGWQGQRSWAEVDDPVRILFVSGNYWAGNIGPADCRLLADRLWELAVEHAEEAGAIAWFIDELEAGAQAGESISWSA